MTPQALNIKGSPQPEVFRGTVEAMVQALVTDAATFWQKAFDQDGPIEIWEIIGIRFLCNGNLRYQAAVQAGAELPDFMIRFVDKTGSNVPTFALDQLDWLPGLK